MDKLLHDIAEAVLAFLGSLVPPALGAIVSLFYETGLTWAQRAARLWVGVTVSYFIMRAGGAMFAVHPYILQAASFLLGLVAYRAAPAFMTGAATVAGELPAQLRDRFLALLPTRKEKK